jgi:hypothetical protein
MSELRSKFVNFTGTGMIVLSRIGYYIRNYPIPLRDKMIESLGRNIDWSRDAEIWQGNIVLNGRMSTQRMPVELAVIRVKEQLGISLTDSEIKRSSKRAVI